jgi:hypothetical protein
VYSGGSITVTRGRLVGRHVIHGGVSMLDFAFLSLALIFFAASWGFVWVCGWLKDGGV